MPTLLQFGRRVINMDLAFEIEDYGNRIRIFYAVTSSDSAGAQQAVYADLDGTAATAFRAWLADHATQLLSDDVSAEPDAREDSGLLQQAIASDRQNAGVAAESDDASFYGATRIRQMHGVGSDSEADDAGGTGQMDTR